MRVWPRAQARGWSRHAPVIEEYLTDLAASVAAVRAGAGASSPTPVVY
jgi:hypothetical protein